MTRAHDVLRQIRQVAIQGMDAEVSDQELVRRFVGAGDVAALELLIWRHQRLVLGVCLRVLKNVHDAEDAAQAAFLVLARKARSIRNGQAVAAWLYEVAYRIGLTALSRRRRQTARVLPLAEDVADGLRADQPCIHENRELIDLLDRAVNRLPAKHRAAVVLCYLEGKTQEEVGRLLGCAAGTIASRLSRARQKLRGWLERHGVTLSTTALAMVLNEQAATVGSARDLVKTARAAQALSRGVTALSEVSPAALVLSEQVVRAMTWAKLQPALLTLFLTGLIALGLGAILTGAPGTSAAPGAVGVRQTDVQKKTAHEHVDALVKQLGSAKYAERQAAQKALLELGPEVVPWLDHHKQGADLETLRRLEIIRYQLVGYSEDILKFLESQSPVYEDKSPEVPDWIKSVVAKDQPKSGNLLLALVADTQHRLHWPAVNLFVQTWHSQSTAQVEAYLQSQLRLRSAFRPRYPAGIDAGIEMGFHLHYGWGSWPKGLEWQTRTTHYLDGQRYGEPFLWNYPGSATTGWIGTGKLAEGKHTHHFVVEYTLTHQGKQHQGKVRSRDFAFEIVAADTPDDLVAPRDDATAELVRKTLQILECEEMATVDWLGGHRDTWAPQITWKTPAGKDAGLHVPVWGVPSALPVDLCFAVTFEDLGTGKTYQGDPLILLKGKTSHRGYLTLRDVHAFCKDRTGFVTVRVHLTPSRALALSVPEVTRYFASPHSQVLRLKITGQEKG
jgi:RNA polymerase sigma factor (sigma-70 family)